jgi:hypothetical protein
MNSDQLLNLMNVQHEGQYSGYRTPFAALERDASLDAVSFELTAAEIRCAPADLVQVPKGSHVVVGESRRLAGPFVYPVCLLPGCPVSYHGSVFIAYTLCRAQRELLRFLFLRTCFLSGDWMFVDGDFGIAIERRPRPPLEELIHAEPHDSTGIHSDDGF